MKAFWWVWLFVLSLLLAMAFNGPERWRGYAGGGFILGLFASVTLLVLRR